MTMNKKLMCTLLAAAALSTLSGCRSSDSSPRGEPQPTAVRMMKPRVDSIAERMEFPAFIRAFHEVRLNARVDGYLKKRSVQEGSSVQQGDLLFEIDPRPFEAQAEVRRAELRQAAAQRTYAAAKYKRALELVKANAISKEELETRRFEMQNAEAEEALAKDQLETALLNLEFTQIRAPISGKLGEILLKEGNLVKAGQSELTTLIDDQNAYADFKINDKAFLKLVRAGVLGNVPPFAPIQAWFDDGERRYPGELSFTDNAFDPQTLTYTLKLQLKASPELAANRIGRVTLELPISRDLMLIPDKAVQTELTDRFVWISSQDGTAQKAKVRVGRLFGSEREILEGLKPEDTVVLSAQQKLRIGTKLRSIEEKAQ